MRSRPQPQINESSPNVAINSLKSWAPPARTCCDTWRTGSATIKMSGPHAQHRARRLRRYIARNLAPSNPGLARVRQRDGRIEMRTGDRPEGKDERDQHSARRQRVREERDVDIAAAQALAHDAGANDRRQQQRCSEQLSNKTARQCHKQQPGAQRPSGFFARTKALMNLS